MVPGSWGALYFRFLLSFRISLSDYRLLITFSIARSKKILSIPKTRRRRHRRLLAFG